jgi:hypothetical protein
MRRWASRKERMMQRHSVSIVSGLIVDTTTEDGPYYLASEVDAEIERLISLIESQGREHTLPCLLGPLCPWCEIAALQARIKELEGALKRFSDFILEECDEWPLAHEAARNAKQALKGGSNEAI